MAKRRLKVFRARNILEPPETNPLPGTKPVTDIPETPELTVPGNPGNTFISEDKPTPTRDPVPASTCSGTTPARAVHRRMQHFRMHKAGALLLTLGILSAQAARVTTRKQHPSTQLCAEDRQLRRALLRTNRRRLPLGGCTDCTEATEFCASCKDHQGRIKSALGVSGVDWRKAVNGKNFCLASTVGFAIWSAVELSKNTWSTVDNIFLGFGGPTGVVVAILSVAMLCWWMLCHRGSNANVSGTVPWLTVLMDACLIATVTSGVGSTWTFATTGTDALAVGIGFAAVFFVCCVGIGILFCKAGSRFSVSDFFCVRKPCST